MSKDPEQNLDLNHMILKFILKLEPFQEVSYAISYAGSLTNMKKDTFPSKGSWPNLDTRFTRADSTKCS